VHTIDELVAHQKIDIKKTVKTLLVKGRQHPLVALVLRGDHTLNAIKAEKHPLIAAPLTLVEEPAVRAALKCGFGSIGPVNLSLPSVVDKDAAALANFSCGANEDGYHLLNVNWQRDAELSNVFDLRNVVAGDPSPDGKGTLQLTRGIEVGHVFQLGEKYSEALGATVQDEKGETVTLKMGCYGIGVSRVVAAAIEQNHDEQGIVWPEPIAPFQIALVPIGYDNPVVRVATDKLYDTLLAAGFDVLLDDRDERPGVKFADMELIGIPHRLVVSERGLKTNSVEYKQRKGGEAHVVAFESVLEVLAS
jgi:prolyl-tRNA synthetase